MSWGEEEVLEEVTVKQLEDKAAEVAKAKELEKELTKKTEEAELDRKRLETELYALLSQAGITSYRSRVGLFTQTTKESVSMLADTASRNAFFGWLRERNIYDEVITVNSQKLQALYRAALEEAEAAGNLNYKIPGLSEPFKREAIHFTAPKVKMK